MANHLEIKIMPGWRTYPRRPASTFLTIISHFFKELIKNSERSGFCIGKFNANAGQD